MDIYCTRPGCARPHNAFGDLDDRTTLKTVQQKYCTNCGMPLILIGRYLPLRLLGRGGFGAAFLAIDRYTPAMQQCVVKQFLPSGNLTPQAMQLAQELFAREAEVLEALGKEHLQIPDLLADFPLEVDSPQSGKAEQFFYLVQEFIDGENLEEELARKGTFSEAEVVQVLTETLRVLEFVHDRDCIHRDIKPSNIMRHRNGRLYLLDFGAVKQAAAGSGQGGRSTGIYSMGFAPPEQMAGGRVYPATDLYALAVTCVTLLTGKEPLELFDSYSNRWNWRSQVEVSDRLAEVLDRMLQASPSDRFSSAREALDALTPPRPRPQTRIPPPPPPPRPPAPTPAPTPTPPLPTPTPRTPPLTPRRSFSMVQVMAGAAFTGYMGGLIFVALFAVLPLPGGVIVALGTAIAGGLAWVQRQRWIEGKDLPIFAGLMSLVMLIPALQGGLPLAGVFLLAGFAALVGVAIATTFRLAYLVLSRLL